MKRNRPQEGGAQEF
uniref:Uncharacterized protein n=1 Tax=Anguilla anguilla TaxID=7936 RepID=A0A0E9QX59_ANGAN